MFFGAFRKSIGLFLLAFGIGVAIAILLPVWCWIVLVGIVIAILRNNLVILLGEVII